MSIFLFLLVLFVLVLVHEWGHYITAKKTGMRVDEFAIGFPPKLFGVKKGETEYNFNLFPIGGYVRIYGENAEDDGKERAATDVGRAFHERPKWAQAVVLVAGITMNILFAWLLFTTTLIIGVPTAVEEANAGPDAVLMVAGTLKGSPADGLLPSGATILNATVGSDILLHPTPITFSEFVSSHAAGPIAVTYTHKGTQKTIPLTPKTGISETNPDKPIVGASLSLVEIQKESFFTAVYEGGRMTLHGTASIATGLYSLARDALFGKADFSAVAGPVGIVGMVGDAASYGLTPLLTFTAIISLNLAVVNLLPFPALDGGRLVFVFIEAITKRRVPAQWTGWINLVGFGLLMLLMAAVTFNDISRLF